MRKGVLPNDQRSGLQGWVGRVKLEEVLLGRSVLHSSGRQQSWLGVFWQPVWGLAVVLTPSSTEINLVTR